MTLLDALGAPLTLPREGTSARPAVGDVWVLSADGQDRGIVLVAAVGELHVLAWPLTLPSPASAAPAFPVEVPVVGTLVAWPDAEFGLSMAALDRCLGRILDERLLREIRWSLTEDPGRVLPSCPELDTPEATEAFEEVCMQAWVLGDWAWPDTTVGDSLFAIEALKETGIDAAKLARTLRVSPGRASALVRGAKVPAASEVTAVMKLFPEDVKPNEILAPIDGDVANVLSLPEYKSRVRPVMTKLGVTERRARTLAWESADSKAARQSTHDPLAAARARVDFALNELLSEEE